MLNTYHKGQSVIFNRYLKFNFAKTHTRFNQISLLLLAKIKLHEFHLEGDKMVQKLFSDDLRCVLNSESLPKLLAFLGDDLLGISPLWKSSGNFFFVVVGFELSTLP
jgi:hypothetical protein